ncbi:hypothetical protein, unknown function [Leishmania donovani]|uniref:Uncharacterized protein n=1 Tax=Leishmania donovani TaxID=5661 RepID=E9BPU8_LEIDO|nr:hypothetical protein, unknown function [Leishmania donovani]CBZ37160.1 hypothetical protein, unknown function [Leishmania donovani]
MRLRLSSLPNIMHRDWARLRLSLSTQHRADPVRQHCAQWSADARAIWHALYH